MTSDDAHLHAEHPMLGLLLTRGTDLIAAALDPTMSLASEAKPAQIRFSPGRSALVQYQASCATPIGTTNQSFVASTGRTVPPGTAVVTVDRTPVAIWRVPHDPFLPGLPAVESTTSVGGLLRQLGIDAEPISLRRRSYRPGRRAVVEITTESDRVFAKVVRPSRVAELQLLHSSLADVAPIPRSLGWSASTGIAMLQALPGEPLRRAIEVGADDLPNAASIIALLRPVGAVSVSSTTRPRLVERVREHAAFLGAVHPNLADRADRIAFSISDHEQPEPRTTIHGDLHASQIMVSGGSIRGLIDVDTVGIGEPSDDLANLLAHLATLAIAVPEAAPRMSEYGAELIRGFDAVTDPQQLRLRIAASLLGYATGPFRVQEVGWRQATVQRVALTERWLVAAVETR